MRGSMLVVALGLLAGCSMEPGQAPTRAQGTVATAGVNPVHALEARAGDSPAIAALPDRGALVAYERGGRGVVQGAHTWHLIQLSEAHALRAVAPGGELVVPAPDGRRIRLRYVRHIEHADGNWTWVGREPGALPGTEAPTR